MNIWYVYTVMEIIYVCMFVCIYLHICHTLRTVNLHTYIRMYIDDNVFIRACMAAVCIQGIESIVCMY